LSLGAALLALLCVSLAVGSATGAAQGVPQGATEKLSPRLQLLAQPATRALARQDQAVLLSLPAAGSGSLQQDAQGRVVVLVRVSDTGGAALAALAATGVQIVHVDAASDTVSAMAPPEALSAVAALPQVRSVLEELQPSTDDGGSQALALAVARAAPGASPLAQAACDPIVSEGDQQLQADLARSSLGVDGTGVTVAAISTSYDREAAAATNAAEDVANGELPGPGNPCGYLTPVDATLDYTGTVVADETDEGRAMLQIVHGLAPGAKLIFATAYPDIFSFANTIRAVRFTDHADIIVDDFTYNEDPMFQDGPVSAAISDVVSSGAVFFTSAGNFNYELDGQNIGSYQAPAYSPTACPARVQAKGALDCHNFGGAAASPASTYTVGAGGVLQVNLQWAEPWYGVTTHLDLFILDSTTQAILASSTADNILSGIPDQFASYRNNTGRPRTLEVVVGRIAGTSTPRLGYLLMRSTRITAASMITSSGDDVVGPTSLGHHMAAQAIAVGAISYAMPYGPSATIEARSTRGPAVLYFGPVSGTVPAPALAVPLTRTEPFITATDGGRNTFFGTFDGTDYRFYGTSAAAPHAAAVAALLEQTARKYGRGFSPQTALAALAAGAQPLPGAGAANAAGAGLVDALTSATWVSQLPSP
jgi:hypothetical protein